jgi:hypothetical protein
MQGCQSSASKVAQQESSSLVHNQLDYRNKKKLGALSGAFCILYYQIWSIDSLERFCPNLCQFTMLTPI